MKTGGQLVNALMVIAVDEKVVGAEQRPKEASGFDGYGMIAWQDLAGWIQLAMDDVGAELRWNILQKSASSPNVQYLKSSTDAKSLNAASSSAIQHFELVGVQFIIANFKLGVGLFVVADGVNIIASRDNESIQ